MGYPNAARYNKRAKQLGLPTITANQYNQMISYRDGFRDTAQAREIAARQGISGQDMLERHQNGERGYWIPTLQGASQEVPQIEAPSSSAPQVAQVQAPSNDLTEIAQSAPSEVGRLDAIGVRSRSTRGTSALRNPRNLSASQMASLSSAARRAGLNLPI